MSFAQKIAEGFPEWSNSLLFDEEKKIIYSSVEGITPKILESYIELFNDYDTTIRRGLTFKGIHYHVHRFYDGIMYGRADRHTKRTDGFCLYRTARKGKSNLHVLITYDLPNVSARVIPLMVKKIEEVKSSL